MILEKHVNFYIDTYDTRATMDGRIRRNANDIPMIRQQTLETKGLRNQIEEIKIFCNKIPHFYQQDKKTYSFKCYRKVCICEKGGNYQSHDFYDPQEFKFIMSTTDGLIYPEKVKEFFDPYSKFCDPRNIDGAPLDPNIPVFILSPTWLLNAICIPLDENDIVVNTNMRQIYPKNADFGRIPTGLTNLLKKGKTCIVR